jgi:folate-dependent phosphoribosylglycinamide formyltransferase PurN
MKNIALFAYNFPHRKTHDFILELVAAGVQNFVVIAAGMKMLRHHDSHTYFDTSIQPCPPILASELCERLGRSFYCVEHDDEERIGEIVRAHRAELAIISGARIIKEKVLSLFPGGVINFHPGKIPETSGLDSFFYTLKNNVPAGVTTHFIDSRVDAGFEVCFDEATVTPSATPETVLENVYHLQRVALRRVLRMLVDKRLSACPIHRPVKNQPMTPEQKIEALSRFTVWRAARCIEQEHRVLIQASESGQLPIVTKILDQLPQLLNQKNDKGWSPLIVAAYHGHFELVAYMLRRGGNPNDCGLKGTTVLMYAKTKMLHAAEPNYSLLSLLIESGADVTRRDGLGKTIIDYVMESNDQRMIEYFMMKQTGANDGGH